MSRFMIELFLLLADKINRFLARYILYLQPIPRRHEKSVKNIENSRCAQNSLAFESERTATNRRSLVWQRTRHGGIRRSSASRMRFQRVCVRACVRVTRRAHLRRPLSSSHSRSPSSRFFPPFSSRFFPLRRADVRVAASPNVWLFYHTLTWVNSARSAE